MKSKLVLLFFCAVLTAIIFFAPVKFLLNFSNDDSFFYIKTACNFSAGNGSTFDSVNLTNGYHPLWFLMLSGLFYLLNHIVTFTPELYFRFVFLFEILICIFTILVLRKAFLLLNFKSAVRCINLFIPLFLLTVMTRDIGTETHIVCFILALYLLVKAKEFALQKYFLFAKCALLVLLFLSRIDFLFTLIPVIIISDYLTSQPLPNPPPRGRARWGLFKTKSNLDYLKYNRVFVITSVFFTAASAIIYFSLNKIFFGNFLNISGHIKNSFPEIVLTENISQLVMPGYLTNHFAKTVFTVVVILIFLYLLKFRKINFSEFDMFLCGMCAGTLCFILLNLAFNFHSIKEWYPAIPAFAGSVLLIRIMDRFPKYYYFCLGLFYFIFVIYFYIARIENSKWDNVYDYAGELKSKTNIGDRIFQIDLCGITGFFSERNVINGDGLANSFEYFESLKTKNLNRYFLEKKINYYSTHSVDNSEYAVTVSSGYYKDSHYSYSFGGYPFIFPEKSLVLKFPFYYEHAVNKYRGSWYLFKLEN